LSVLLGMMVYNFLGITLNMVVLFSLVLVLGMLVDNAIVLVENIYRHSELGKTAFEASVDGTKEVAMPVIASTLTTVAAFAPLLGWTGIMGEFMVYLPLTLVTVLLSSLLVALVMLPVLTSMGIKAKPRAVETSASTHPILRLYKSSLVWAIRHRKTTLLAMVVALFGSFFVYGAFGHGTEFFPDVEPDRATITVRAAD